MKVKLKNSIIDLTEEEAKGFDVNRLDLTDIKNKKELINYIDMKIDEAHSIEVATPLLKKLDIEIKYITTERFAHYDAVAVSASTNTNGEKQQEEEIILEFKNRPNINCNYHESVAIDDKKCRALLNEYYRSKRRVFVIQVYKDKHIRVLEFSKHYRSIDKVQIVKIEKTKYRENDKKIIKLIKYSKFA